MSLLALKLILPYLILNTLASRPASLGHEPCLAFSLSLQLKILAFPGNFAYYYHILVCISLLGPVVTVPIRM